MELVIQEQAAPITEEAIRDWLSRHIATQLGIPLDDIDVTLPFSFYGLDSVAAVGLSGELEDWLGVKLAPTLTWDYPTVATLAQFLAHG